VPQSPTALRTDYNPSTSHRELKNIYCKVPQSPTDLRTDYSPLAFHRELKNIYCKVPQSQTELRTDCSPSAFCRQLTITDKFTNKRCKFQRAGIKCISDRVQMPMKLPTDRENMEGN